MSTEKKTRKNAGPQKGKGAATPPPPQAATPPPEPVAPPPGPGHLPPLPEESAHDHRLFLLWAMQAQDRRSFRLTAKAAGISEMTIRRKYKKKRWAERIQAVRNSRPDALAWREYLARYAEMYQLQGIGLVQANMDVTGPETPLAVIRRHLAGAADPRAYGPESAARIALEGAAEMSRHFLGDRLPGDEDEEDLDEEEDEDGNPVVGKEGVRGGASSPPSSEAHGSGATGVGATPPPGDDLEALADPEARRKRVQDYRKLIRGTLGVYARDLTLGRVRVSPRDMALLIELEEALAGVSTDSGKKGPMESVRVRTARENGEDVLDALLADHQEMGVVLHALREKKIQEAEHLREELARGTVVDLPVQDAG